MVIKLPPICLLSEYSTEQVCSCVYGAIGVAVIIAGNCLGPRLGKSGCGVPTVAVGVGTAVDSVGGVGVAVAVGDGSPRLEAITSGR